GVMKRVCAGQRRNDSPMRPASSTPNEPRHLLQRQGHADASRAGPDDGDIQAVHQDFLLLAPPWRALKRGFDLQMT
ncbi:MAG TPA: hypothetical protein VGC69_15180, partial [Bordetella sp.]